MAGGGGEQVVEARIRRGIKMVAEFHKHTETELDKLLRFRFGSPTEEQQTGRRPPKYWKLMERFMFAYLSRSPVSFDQWFEQLTTEERKLVRLEKLKVDHFLYLTRILYLLEQHITSLKTQYLPKDTDRGKSAMEEQLPSINSTITCLDTKRDGSGDDHKEEVEMGRVKSFADMLMEVEYLKHLQSELGMMEAKYVKQLQSELRSSLKSINVLFGNPETEQEMLLIHLRDTMLILPKAESLLKQRGYTDAHFKISTPISDWMGKFPSCCEEEKTMGPSSRRFSHEHRGHSADHPESMDATGESILLMEDAKMEVSLGSKKGKHRGHSADHPESMDATGESILLMEDAKMEEESSSLGEQQVLRIQDSELKSEPTVDDPFVGFLLDMPFASADDDDKKEDIINRGKSAEQIANEKEMASEEKKFASYRMCWEDHWKLAYGSFVDMTVVSPMHFTHSTPGHGLDDAACFAPTLQIFTLRLAEIKGGLEWPLSVYGVVAARDDVDHNRNLLFSCDRSESQKLDKDDPFLRLIGPSRAILFTDHVKFEVQLRVKGRTVSQDRALISAFYHYTGGYYPGVSTICFKNCFCTTELCMERIEQTVQATVLSIRVKNGPWPFEYGGEVACFSPSYNTAPSSMNVVLLASRGISMPKGSDGYLHLTRNVVSVEVKGSLTFFIRAYSQSGEIAAQAQVRFMPKDCNISSMACSFGDPKVEVEIFVAWSALVSDKGQIAAEGGVFEIFKEQGWMFEDSKNVM